MNSSRKNAWREIEDAFKDVRLDGGLSLEGAWLLDAYRNVEAAREKSASSWGVSWKEVRREEVKPNFWAFSFLEEIGWRYYLPAYVNLILNGRESLDEELLDHLQTGILSMGDELREKLKLLNSAQMNAITCFFRMSLRIARSSQWLGMRVS